MRTRLSLSLMLALMVTALVAPAAGAAPSPLVLRDVNLGVITGVETFSITATNRSDEPFYFGTLAYGGTGAAIDGWVSDAALVNECYNLFGTRHPLYLEPGESCTAQFRVQPVEGYSGRIELEYCISGEIDHCARIRGRVAAS